jgi:GntR family transcriptional regulator, arabinose operon transcriptional repressor
MAAKLNQPSRKTVPYYEQVANVLRTHIAGGDDRKPVQLPPERDLCEIHQVSRITIRKALELLEREGLVQRTRGRGTLTIPDAIRKWKRLRQSRVIHILANWQSLVDVPNSFYGQVYQGICRRAEAAGYRLTTLNIGHRAVADPNVQMPDPVTTLGVIFVGLMNESMVQLYTQAGHPLVCVDYWTTQGSADAIVVDCYSEGQIAAEFLLRQGHSNLFYAGNLLKSAAPAQEKESDAELLLAGLQRGLTHAGADPIPPERICFLNPLESGAAEAAAWFLALSPRPTAGVIFNSDLMSRFISRMSSQGIRCPEDLSLITKAWQTQETVVTCLRTDAAALGELAVDSLLDRALGRRTIPIRLAVPSRLDRGRTVRQLALDTPR